MIGKQRTNSEWLSDLRGSKRNVALNDLRAILVRGLRFGLANRIKTDLEEAVEDFAQDALLKILDNLDTFRGESRFTTWAQKIAIRVALTELRRQRWKDISLQDLVPEDNGIDFTPALLADPSPNPENLATRKIMLDLVRRMIKDHLTKRQRDAMIAVLIGGMPMEEVARRMGTNRNALYKLLHDARKRLKNVLIDEGISPDEILATFSGQ